MWWGHHGFGRFQQVTNKLPFVMDGCSLALFAYAGNCGWPLRTVVLLLYGPLRARHGSCAVSFLLAASTRKIVSAVWKRFGFFRDAPFYHVYGNVDAPIVERR
jgi:hypothetical protein